MSMSAPPPPFSIPTNDYNLHIPQQPQQQQQQHQNSHSSSSSLSNLSPSIIITLLILSATIITTTCLFLICRHFQRLSSFFRRCRSQRTVFLSSDHHHQHHHMHHPNTNPTNSLPNPNNSSALIDSLPLFSYSSVTRRSSSSDGNDCAVCLSRFKAHDQLRLLPLCCHAFHAQCVDTWLVSNHTCPLCRSNVYASEAEMASILNTTVNADRGTNSFRLEIGSISQRRAAGTGTGTGTGSNSFDARRSYSVGSFDYIVDGESEVAVVSSSDKEETMTNAALAAAQYFEFEESSLAADIGGERSWLGEYMDRLSATVSSRAASFRGSSRRFFSGSSRRSEVAGVGEWELDSSRVGEEISELFRWASGV